MPKAKASQWSIDAIGGGVHRLDLKPVGRAAGWASLSSDWHYDSTHCRRDLLKENLDLALATNTPVCVFGDLFDSMQGKNDKRGSKSDIRPEYLVGSNYFDAIVEDAASFLHPYRSVLALITPGNHETAVRKAQETCLTTRLVERLRAAGSPVRAGGYSGWLWVTMQSDVTRKTSASLRIFYHHGSGGGSAQSRGTLEFARISDYVDADAIVCGHIHQRGIYEARRHRLSTHGNVTTKSIWHVRLGAFKDEYHNGEGGWAVERGMGPRPYGGWWLRLKPNHDRSDLHVSWHDSHHE